MPSGVGVFWGVFSPQNDEHGRALWKTGGAGVVLWGTASVWDSSRPMTASTLPRLLGMESGAVLLRTCLPFTEYSANDVENALAAWEAVPVASTYFWFAGTPVTLKPWPVSHFLTAFTSAVEGENCARN